MTLVKSLPPAASKNGKQETTQDSKEPKSAPIKINQPDTGIESSLEDRLFKLNRLFELQTKYNRLEQSLTTLKEFDLKKEGENISLELYDETSRRRFQTKNSEVVPEIVSALREIIIRRKKAIEPLLNW